MSIYGWQNSRLTPLQKSFAAPGEVEDGGKVYVPVTIIDEGILKSATEAIAFLNLADARQAILEAIQRDDSVIKSQDAALFDLGKIRRAVVERIYPSAGVRWDGTPGSPMIKSRGAVAARAEAHAASQMGAHHSADPVRAMLAQHRGATVGNATPHRFEASAHQDGSCAACGHRETQAGANHLAKSGDPVRTAYAAFAQDPSNSMGDMKKAAQELDDLIEHLDRDR